MRKPASGPPISDNVDELNWEWMMLGNVKLVWKLDGDKYPALVLPLLPLVPLVLLVPDVPEVDPDVDELPVLTV